MRNPSAVALLLALSLVAMAQEQQESPPIMEGMPLSVSVTRDLSTARAKVGDSVELIFSGEVKDRTGKVLLNRKSKLTGRVTDVVKRDSQHGEARLAIVVDRAESGGTRLPLHAVFCGNLQLPNTGQSRRIGGQDVWIGPPADWQLPRDLELKPMTDPKSGSTLVSKQDNIELVHGRPFFICQQNTVAPTTAAESRPIVPPSSLPSGVQLIVTLQTALDASRARNGDPVEMVMFSNLLGPGQTIAIPKDARVGGRVLVSEAASKSGPSRLAIIVERASWSGGSVPLDAFIAEPPALPPEVMSQMLTKGGIQSVNLRDISVEELPSGGSGLTRTGETIRLPQGTQLVLRTH